MKQHTIGSVVELSGSGLHTGKNVNVKLHPAEAGSGIKFKVVDSEGNTTIIPADVNRVSATSRSTSLKSGDTEVHTVEHLLAALYCSHVHNVTVELNGNELPILDGSSIQWIKLIEKAGLQEQDVNLDMIEIQELVQFTDTDTGATYTVIPSENFELSITIDFNSSVVAPQHASMSGLDAFKDEIAHCRTFVFLKDVLHLQKSGLIKGGNLNNAILIADSIPDESTVKELREVFPNEQIDITSPGIYANGGLAFSNEMARHKLLDLIGDLALTGFFFKGKIMVHKPSHKSNTAFATFLKNHIKEAVRQRNVPVYDPNSEPLMNILDISKILPHRYPFLLVDKIIELSDNYVVGVKNVTMNEHFFEGHFPGNPVMPGVLQIEAMAQTGGILAISLMPKGHEYDTYFLKIDKVKFKQKVGPGDTIIFKMELMEPIRRGICIMQGTAFIGNKLISEAILTAQMVPKDKRQ